MAHITGGKKFKELNHIPDSLKSSQVVNSRSCSLYAIDRPSVVCNVRAPYSGGSIFRRQYFYGIKYLGHPLTSTDKNSSGDEIANVNFYAVRPGSYRNSLK